MKSCIICKHGVDEHNLWPDPKYPALSCLREDCDCKTFRALNHVCVKCKAVGRTWLFQPDPDDADCPESYHCNDCIENYLAQWEITD